MDPTHEKTLHTSNRLLTIFFLYLPVKAQVEFYAPFLNYNCFVLVAFEHFAVSFVAEAEEAFGSAVVVAVAEVEVFEHDVVIEAEEVIERDVVVAVA